MPSQRLHRTYITLVIDEEGKGKGERGGENLK